MPQRTLIIPDIHNRIDWVRPFISSIDFDSLVFLGDFFDREKDPGDTLRTALWLKETLLMYPQAHFILGNHDAHYRYPDNQYLKSAGFTWEKCDLINSIITESDWSRFTLYVVEQGWLISHAGVSDVVFRPPGRMLDIKWVEQACGRAMINAKLNKPDDVLEPDARRGGKRREGGIIWLDWQIFVPLPGINQIVGHSVDQEVRDKHLEKDGQIISMNYCIDTACRYAGFIQDGEFFIAPTPLSELPPEDPHGD
jgi:hypothetical protein